MESQISHTFCAGDFCSRKLFELVQSSQRTPKPVLSNQELQDAVIELTSRRHYLVELARHGLINSARHH